MTQLHHPQVLLRNPTSANHKEKRTPILLQHCSQQLGQGTSLFVHKQRSSVWEDVGSLQPRGVGGWRGGFLWEHEDLSWNLQHSGSQTWVQQPHTRTRRSSDITVSFRFSDSPSQSERVGSDTEHTASYPVLYTHVVCKHPRTHHAYKNNTHKD